MKSVNLSGRKASLVQAYLGSRLDRSQLQSMLKEVDSPESDWTDRFESSTGSRIEPGSSGPVEPLQELGLTERYRRLDDDQVWSAEDRAIQRHLSKLDLPRRTRIESADPPQANFVESAQAHFDEWDRDHSLSLNRSELDFAMSGGFYGSQRESAESPESAAALAIMRRHIDYLQSAYPQDGAGVSKTDLLVLDEAQTDQLATLKSMMNEDYHDYLQTASRLAERKPLEQENIDPKVIHQGVVGSCVLLSTLAGIPKDALRSMLSTNPDGTLAVSFADGRTEHVSEPTVAERLYHAKGESLERWPALFELAMAQRLYHADQPEDSALRSAIDGIDPEEAFKAVTNLDTDTRSLDELSVNQTRLALLELTSREGPVICGSRPKAVKDDFISVEEMHNGIQNGHCYTVLGFDAEKDKITLRNPWGRKEWEYQDSAEDGVFEMPVHDFYASFRWLAGVA